jgi:arsenical pump membrane protein
MSPHVIIWTIVALVTAEVVIRPFDWPEAVWAVNGGCW